MISTLEPSDRGELEITDVNNHYIARGATDYDIIEGLGNAGESIDAYYKVNDFVRAHGANATCVMIPPGMAHGCRALELTHLLYVTFECLQRRGRGPNRARRPSIGFDWTAFPEIK